MLRPRHARVIGHAWPQSLIHKVARRNSRSRANGIVIKYRGQNRTWDVGRDKRQPGSRKVNTKQFGFTFSRHETQVKRQHMLFSSAPAAGGKLSHGRTHRTQDTTCTRSGAGRLPHSGEAQRGTTTLGAARRPAAAAGPGVGAWGVAIYPLSDLRAVWLRSQRSAAISCRSVRPSAT